MVISMRHHQVASLGLSEGNMIHEFTACRVSGDGNAVFPDEIIIDDEEEVVTFRMPQWQLAGEVQELTPLFQGGAPQMPPMPGI